MPATECFWAQPVDSLFAILSSGEMGLTGEEAAKRSGESDILKNPNDHSSFQLFFRQFKSPIILLLVVSAFMSFALGERSDALIILFILLLSAVLGFYQEQGARNTIRKLLQLVQVNTKVLRDGKTCIIPMANIVPGDVLTLSAGNTVPGDCRLLSSKDLFTNESSLTGETFPVEKKCGDLPNDTVLSNRSNSLFMGTTIVNGIATAMVVHTGKRTEFGKISVHLRNLQPETAFEHGIRRFGYMLLEVTLVLVLVIFCINAFAHKPILDSFLFSLAIAVGLTPQLLPAIISVNLARGSMQMARKSVIVKKLSAIENFGSMDVLCSDKTGTITQGEIVIERSLDIGGRESDVLFRLAWLNAFFESGYSNPVDQALLRGSQLSAGGMCKRDEVPYDFSRKMLSVLIGGPIASFLSVASVPGEADSPVLITKGAFENILAICHHAGLPGEALVPIDIARSSLRGQYEQFSGQGYRILGVAWKYRHEQETPLTKADEMEMVFGGILLLTDPPKAGIQQTLDELRGLGITLKIITGDNALVAAHVAGVIGVQQPRVLSGEQMKDMSLDALARIAPGINIFAAVEPNQKEKILLALKKAGHVVGYIGDGINDAPALHAADVGISVNNAADVARQAADIVLMESDLRVLADGVREGRKTFMNTLKYIFMATSANFGNMFSMAGSSIFLSFLPLLPKQVLLANLLTDIPEMTIASDSVDPATVRTPRRIDLRFIRRFMIVFGLLSSFFDYATFWVLLKVLNADTVLFRTAWFVESVTTATSVIFVVRTSHSVFRSRPGRYLQIASLFILTVTIALPYSPLNHTLGLSPLPVRYYPWLLLILLSYLSAAEIVKHFFYKKHILRAASTVNRLQ